MVRFRSLRGQRVQNQLVKFKEKTAAKPDAMPFIVQGL
jgi:hypothetical protein